MAQTLKKQNIVAFDHSVQPNTTFVLHAFVNDQEIQDNIQTFWEFEEPPVASRLSPEKIQALQHFKNTHSRGHSGRYVVVLPKRSPKLTLGSSKEQATRRFLQNERILSRKGK